MIAFANTNPKARGDHLSKSQNFPNSLTGPTHFYSLSSAMFLEGLPLQHYVYNIFARFFKSVKTAPSFLMTTSDNLGSLPWMA